MGRTSGAAVVMVLLVGCFAEAAQLDDDDEVLPSTSEGGTDGASTTSAITDPSTSMTAGTTAMSSTDATTDDPSASEATSGSESGPDESSGTTETGTTSDEGTSGESSEGESSEGESSGGESSGGESSGGESSTGEPSGCEPLAPDAGTVALWHFDEGGGQTAGDGSGNGRHLQLGAAAGVDAADPTWDEGRFGGGLSFASASEQYATRNSGNDFADNALSVELWVRTSSTEYAQIFTAGTINCFVALLGNGSGVDFGIGDGNNWSILGAQVPGGTLDDGQWHAIATTYDGATMRVYVDGVEIDAMPAVVDLADPGDYKVGGRPANTFLDGDMDEVRLSDVARTAEEIAAAFDDC